MKMAVVAVVVGVTVLTYPGLARADAPTDADNSAQAIPEIIVTAQRRQEREQDVPISITVATGVELETAGVTDTRGLERLVPGLTLQQQNGYVNPSLRGISTSTVTAGSENPIAIYLDGVYVSNMGASYFSLPDVDQVEVLKGPQGTLFGRNATGGAVQVFTKNPSMTPTGEVSLVSGYYTGAGDSLSAYDLTGKGYVSGPLIKDVIAASVAFSVHQSDGFGQNVEYNAISPAANSVLDLGYGGRRAAALKDYLLRAKFLVTPTDDLSILFIESISNLDGDRAQGGYIAYNGTALTPAELAFPNRITGTAPWQYAFDAYKPENIQDAHGSSVKIDWRLGLGTLTSTSAYSWNKYQEYGDSDASYIPGCLAAFACTAPYDFIKDTDFQQDLVFASRDLGRFSFVSGIDYFHSNAEVFVQVNDFPFGAPPLGNTSNPSLFFYTQTVKTKALGIFTEGNFKLTDTLTLIAGMRYSDEKKDGILNTYGSGNTIFLQDYPLKETAAKRGTPRLSLRYAIDERSNAYFTFSEGFKSGVIPGGAPAAPEVRPETIKAYEVGYKTAQSIFSMNAAAFYYDYRDIQVQTNGGSGGVVNVVANAARAKIYGAELDNVLQLSNEFSVHSGVSWLPYAKYLDYKNVPVNLPRAIDPANPTNINAMAGQPGVFYPGETVDLSGTRMFKTPKVTFSFGATYQVDFTRGIVSLSPNLYYASTLYTDPTHLSALSTDQLKVGAELAYKPKDASWRMSLWGKNLTNDSAFVSLSNNGSGLVIIPGDPREIGATLTFAF